MIGPQLQVGIYAALMAAPAVAGGAVYDQAPPDAPFPRVTIGDEQVLDDGNTCGDGWEVFHDIHIWSRPVAGSKLEAKAIAALVVARVIDTYPVVAGFRVIVANLHTSRALRDKDGKTEQIVLTCRYRLIPA